MNLELHLPPVNLYAKQHRFCYRLESLSLTDRPVSYGSCSWAKSHSLSQSSAAAEKLPVCWSLIDRAIIALSPLPPYIQLHLLYAQFQTLIVLVIYRRKQSPRLTVVLTLNREIYELPGLVP